MIGLAIAHPTPAVAQKQTTKQTATPRANLLQGLRDSAMVQLSITVDKARTVACDQDFTEVLVANPAIADVVALSNKQLYVLGKKAGLTSISLVGSDKRVIGLINVEVSHDVDGLQRRLRELIPGSNISVTSVNGKVLLTGTVPDAGALSRALVIAEQVAPQLVSNAMTVRGSQQVLLEVRFVEATRDSSRELGIGWDVIGNRIHGLVGVTGAVKGFSGTAGALPVLGNLASSNAPFGVAIARLLDGGTKADVIIQALERRGLARRLAEPNLVALSGDTASFLAGGEFPFPVQADRDRITVEFKKFGVGLAFTPTVLGEGLINLRIEPEVSELEPTNSLRVNGIDIPSLMVRRTQTTIELRDGQSFAIAGLLYSNNYKNQSQLPWIGEVPVLGTLFRSAAFQRKETDLVIIVTPRLVRPARPDQKLATPVDTRLPSNDAEFFLRGQQEVRAARPQPFHGHMLELGSKAGANNVSK
ncbi:MAG: type II and III secretion system protein family protein [Rhodospirillales bacterium]|nr:type II and III secretion system protein family protein [Rhodospirillales bacterium]